MNRPQTSFLQSLKDANNISSSENFFGSLVLGGYDSARFDNKSQITVPFNGDDEKDLTIQVNTISTNISSDPLTTAAMNLVIDSTIPYLYLPESSYQLFEKAFGLEWNDTVELYLINETHYDNLVKQSAELKFNVGTINTTEIVFPIAAFLLTASFPLLGDDSSTSYYFPIKRTNDKETFTLGRAFLQEAYIIYDYERSFFTLAPCTWPSDTAASPPSAPTIIPSVNETSSHDSDNNNHNTTNDTAGLSAAAIAGAAIGGIVAGLLLATLLACIWLRRRRRLHSRRPSHSTSASTTKFPPFSPHTRHSSLTTLPPQSPRPRSGSRLIASFFRNPWASLSTEDEHVVYELAVDPSAPTPAERAAGEHKRQLSSELDAEVCAVHEMFQPKAEDVRSEMPGDGPLPTYESE
ncbi:putative peptidase a1 [Diplodia seriata]|uniref:Putative peptidase a1 n=1 Tax=Diplodia seriata TaxID=420778 RepID=A0A0G2FMG4_9PEZI|nr:putative peptidase a1 [Diplodia seriata]